MDDKFRKLLLERIDLNWHHSTIKLRENADRLFDKLVDKFWSFDSKNFAAPTAVRRGREDDQNETERQLTVIPPKRAKLNISSSPDLKVPLDENPPQINQEKEFLDTILTIESLKCSLDNCESMFSNIDKICAHLAEEHQTQLYSCVVDKCNEQFSKRLVQAMILIN